MTDLTPRQDEILRHAIGISVGNAEPYRRHFVTGPGANNFQDCVLLTESGYFRRYPEHPMCGGDDLFIATQKTFDHYGKEYAR